MRELLASPVIDDAVHKATEAVNASTTSPIIPVRSFLPPEATQCFAEEIVKTDYWGQNFKRERIGGKVYQNNFAISSALSSELEPMNVPATILRSIYERAVRSARPVGSWKPESWWVNWMLMIKYPEGEGTMTPHVDVEEVDGPTLLYTAAGEARMVFYDPAAFALGELIEVSYVDLEPNTLVVIPGSKMGIRPPHAIVDVVAERVAITATHTTELDHLRIDLTEESW